MLKTVAAYSKHVQNLAWVKNAIYRPVGELAAAACLSKEPIAPSQYQNQTFKPIECGEAWANLFDCALFRFSGVVPAGAAGQPLAALLDVSGEGLLYDLKNGLAAREGITHVFASDLVQTAAFVAASPGKSEVRLSNAAKAGEPIELLLDAGYNANYDALKQRAKRFLKAICPREDLPATAEMMTLLALMLTEGKDAEMEDADAVVAISEALQTLPADTVGSSGFFESLTDGYAALLKKQLVSVDLSRKEYYYDYLTLLLLALSLEGAGQDTASTDAVQEALEESFVHATAGQFAAARELLSDWFRTTQPAKENCLEETKETPVAYTAVGHGHLDLGWLWPVRESHRKAARTMASALRHIGENKDYIFGASQAQQFAWIKEEDPALYERIREAVAAGRIEIQGGMWTENDSNVPCGESLIRQFLYGEHFFGSEFSETSRTVWLPDAFGFPASLPQIYLGCGKKYFMTIKLSWNEHNAFPYNAFLWEGIDGSRIVSHIAPAGDYSQSGSPVSVMDSQTRNTQKESVKEALLIFGSGDGGGGPGEAHLAFLDRVQGMRDTLPPVRYGKAQDMFEKLEKNKALPVYQGELYLEKHQGTLTSQCKSKAFNAKMERILHRLEFLSSQALVRGLSYPKAQIDSIWQEVLLYQFHDILPGSSIGRVYEESLARYEQLFAQAQALEKDLIAQLGASKLVNDTSFAREEYCLSEEGWVLAKAGPYAAAVTCKPDAGAANCLIADNDRMENDVFALRFAEDGSIASMIDKTTNRDFSAEGLNRLVLYSDPASRYNAWDIDIGYTDLPKQVLRPVSVKTYIKGLSAVRVQRYETGHSVICQTLTLTAGEPLVRVRTEADWHEAHKMLRADFYPAVDADTAVCDIQFGKIRRSMRQDTSIEKAQFEICAHKYIHVEDKNGGFALLNREKYGCRAKEGLVSLNLLRAPKYPDPACDMGRHTFEYALTAYAGSAESTRLSARAYAFCHPLDKGFAEKQPFVATDHEAVVIETIKPAEDGKGIVVRLYERDGKDCACRVTTGFASQAVYLADMLENLKTPTKTNLSFRAYEIKTLYFLL